ncbi:MAG TPA: mandelate racemase/muconate lactonizing enzyme family protein [Chloroflexota bacterium]|nr:mandelate racemase/muconate lactonizing enzyme family protein [Chloroflexota bacterium]
MKITEVESLVLGGAHFVRIATEQGQVGLGQSACWGYPDAVDAVVRTFRGYLLGQDPRQIERHWQHLYRMGPFRGSVLSGAISAVDIALWDIKGQILQAPIWDLLGGKYRDRIRLHLLMGGASAAEISANARSAAEEGFTAIKFDPIPEGFGDMTQDALVRGVAERVAAAREAVNSDVDIILELHRKLTPLQAPPVIEAIAQFNPLFVEDPVQIDSIVSQAEIARRVTTPIANGERMHTIWEFRELLAYGGSQYVRPDVGLAGGLTHTRKIAAIAESFHSAVVTHNYLGPVLTAAAVHLDTAIPNFVVQEYARTDETSKWSGFRGVLQRRGGYLLPPETPGLGIRLVDTHVDAPLGPLGNRPLHDIPLRSDGSVVYAV